ncbi:hypothetical protein HZF05_07185 [Sphingomonas sp. CGMCC 1.13654]|uniref:Uncharacterized protein n=1 Tax=Sphingomonas chungangi TaxID=2683589 RepID=A0A838L5J1_9SPHN|nr:hypothetical protein [Sphingomonas chungangi]MBA2933882.1 hypothetical protein [Sphingomonas chungangi]MVW55211.1 hypothetical protein [Sphingomonas chungangi]
MTISGATEYDQRKVTVDGDAAEVVFDRHFALGSFKQAMPPGTPLPPETIERIRRGAHLDLARCCLAYLLTVENAPDKPEQTAFLACIRRIRDAAREMAIAADTLADQFVRHEGETGTPELVRENALSRLAFALHGRFHVAGHEAAYISALLPRRINNPFSGNRATHGLTDCVAVYNEATAIIAEYRKCVFRDQPGGARNRGMQSGNRPNRDRQAFIRDLADIYRHVTGRVPKAPNNDKKPAPFVRFVTHVFDEIASQDLVLLDRYAIQPPSVDVIRTVLKNL